VGERLSVVFLTPLIIRFAVVGEARTGPFFGGISVAELGTEEQKERWLPDIADGDLVALGLTEPDAGLDTAGIKTTAERDADEYVLDGTRTWTNGAHVSVYIVTLARTDPFD
jgi:alkylation response protein AidB-like acyl-CoA dehydrogenase